MDFSVIQYGSSEYNEMVDLRHEVLRKPLGLTFSEKDLERDKNTLLLVARFSEKKGIVACCILSPKTTDTAQLRQMAVAELCRGKSVGRQLLSFAESVAVNQGYQYIYLHAREVAVGFYKNQSYDVIGDKFVEVGIPHYEMSKKII